MDTEAIYFLISIIAVLVLVPRSLFFVQECRMRNPNWRKAFLMCADEDHPCDFKIQFGIGLLVVYCFTLVSCPAFHILIGDCKIEYLPQGTYCYYVELESERTGKSYTVPGKIMVDTYETIVEVYFDDGTALTFPNPYSCHGSNNSVSQCDENGQEWECTLTDKHAYSPYVEEDVMLSTWEIILMGIAAFAVFSDALGTIYYGVKELRQKRWEKRTPQ